MHDAPPPATGSPRVRHAATTAVLIALLTAIITASFALSTTRVDGAGRASALPVDRPLRLMIAGDSITHQRDGDHTWRARLWEEFARQQVSVDFVGPRDTTRGIGYTPGARFDTDHAALGGTTVAVEKYRIRRQVAAHRPDVLVAPLGHNDLGQGAAPARVAADMRDYIRAARAAKPRLRIVLGTVMTARKDGRSKFHGSNRALNARYRALAADLGTRRSPIVVAETAHPAWNPARDTFDGVHLTPSGEEKFMTRIAAALHHPRIGVLPDEPRAALPRVRWDPRPTPVVTATRGGHRIALPYRKRRINATSVIAHLRSLDHPAWHQRLPGTGRRGQVTVHPVAGTYRVRLQPIRDSMRGRPGPATTFTVD